MNSEEKKFYHILSVYLQIIRKLRGLTQADIANGLDISMQQYQKYETGKNRIPLYRYLQICTILKLDSGNTLNSLALAMI